MINLQHAYNLHKAFYWQTKLIGVYPVLTIEKMATLGMHCFVLISIET